MDSTSYQIPDASHLNPNVAPSDNFDLLDWKLTLPVDNNKDGKADEIKELQLSDGFENSSYFYTGEDGGMVFKAPVRGSRTSTNTKYTRTELREMLRRGDTSDSTTGVGGNNWVLGSAPSSTQDKAGGVDGELKATLAVNHVTTTGKSSQVGRVIIGQIHANDDEPLRIYYRKLPGNSKGSIYIAHEPQTGPEQWYEMIGSRSNNASNPSDGISLDEKFSYKVNTEGNTLTVSIMRPGKPDVVQEVDMTNSGFDGKDQYMYFKAGVYNQNNTGDSKDYAQATFYALDNNHTGYSQPNSTPTPDPSGGSSSGDNGGGNGSDPVIDEVNNQAPNSSGLNPNVAPSDNFDLLDWKLTLPVDNNKDGKADEIKELQLSDGFENSSYFYTGEDGGMVFKAPVRGPKTSNNTKYTRSELREMLRRGDTSDSTTGVGGNNWVLSSAPSSTQDKAGGVDGELKATLAVNHVTTTGKSSQVGRVIVGQIHANDDEPLRIYYRKLPGNSKGSIYIAHEPRTGSEQWYEMIGSRSDNASNPSDGISLDEKFSYKVKTQGDTLTVSIMRPGKPDVVQEVDMTDSGFDSKDQYMYFKAGVYNQNNTGDSKDYAQATFYALDNNHTGYSQPNSTPTPDLSGGSNGDDNSGDTGHDPLIGDVDFSVKNQWKDGFTGNIEITNTGDKAINGWKLEFDAPFEVKNIWGAEILSHEGNRYEISNAEWNGSLASGKSIELGFNGSNSDNMGLGLSNVELNDVAIGSVDQTLAPNSSII